MDLVFILLILFIFSQKRVNADKPIYRNPEFIHQRDVFRKYYDYLIRLKNI